MKKFVLTVDLESEVFMDEEANTLGGLLCRFALKRLRHGTRLDIGDEFTFRDKNGVAVGVATIEGDES